MRLNIVKRTVMATALAVATAVVGVAGQAQAFTFTNGDLVLAIYGNNTEALYNLGDRTSALSTGISNLNVQSGLAAAQVAPPDPITGIIPPVKYTLFGIQGETNMIYAGSSFTTAGIVGTFDPISEFNAVANMTVAPFGGNTIGKTTMGSFSYFLNTGGADKFEGAWPVAMKGTLDSTLNLMQGSVDTFSISQVGYAMLTSTGLFSLSNQPLAAAVPLPGVAVLFGTGLIGLIGIARRSFNRMAA